MNAFISCPKLGVKYISCPISVEKVSDSEAVENILGSILEILSNNYLEKNKFKKDFCTRYFHIKHLIPISKEKASSNSNKNSNKKIEFIYNYFDTTGYTRDIDNVDDKESTDIVGYKIICEIVCVEAETYENYSDDLDFWLTFEKINLDKLKTEANIVLNNKEKRFFDVLELDLRSRLVDI